MEILVLLILWIISVPICINSAHKLKSNTTVALFAGICLPILAPLIYATLSSGKNDKS